MSDTSATSAAAAPAVTATPHVIQFNNEERTRVIAALTSAARHHAVGASNADLIQSVRTTHQGLHAEYQALVARLAGV